MVSAHHIISLPVEKEVWLPLKVEYYDRKERHLKTLTTDWQEVDGIWTWKRAVMANHLTGHRTEIDIKDVKMNTGLDEGLFNRVTLEKGMR